MSFANDNEIAEKREQTLARLKSRHKKLVQRKSSAAPLVSALIATLEKSQRNRREQTEAEAKRG